MIRSILRRCHSRSAKSRKRALFLLACSIPAFSQAAAPHYLAWGQLYEDTALASQVPHAIAMDSRGNVFVTGQADSGNGQTFYTAKYDSLDGHKIWERTVPVSGTNQYIANAIVIDSQGDCIVTGSRNIAGSIDYYTIKYHGNNGSNFWANPATYNGPNDGEDTALKVVVDSFDQIYVTGRSVGLAGNSTGFDITTIKYSKVDGSQSAIDRYSQTTSNLDDVPGGMTVDSANNIIVAGTVFPSAGNPRLYIRKFNTALAKVWDSPLIATGNEKGATGVAVDSNNGIVATGPFVDGANHYGYFAIKYDSIGQEVWRTFNPVLSESTFGSPRPGPVGVAIGPDNGPIITGTLLDASGKYVIRNVKYTSGGFFMGESSFWEEPSIDTGLGFGDSFARAITTDGASNAIVVGESENEDGGTDLYIAKYDALTGKKVYSTSFNGSQSTSQDYGVDVVTDKFGNIAALGELRANKGGTGIGRREFATVKLNRFIAPTGDELPDNIVGLDEDAKVTTATPPAISDSGNLAARLNFKAGRAAGQAILVEGSAAGGTILPAIKGQPAPVAPGEPVANWVRFSDPVIAPNGTYAFAGKVSGTASKSNGVWTTLSGTLKLALRQGSVVPGTTDKLVKVMSISQENGSLVALVKLTGTASANTAVVRLDSSNNGTVLLRAGQTGVMINNLDHTIKKLTTLAPVPKQAGDGRWQGSLGIVARVDAFQTSDPTAKTSAILSISHGGAISEFFRKGADAASPLTGVQYSGFGLPTAGLGTAFVATKASLTSPAATNAALVYRPNSVTAANAFAQKGVATGVIGLPASLTYGDFTDPIVNSGGTVAYIATLKGPLADVKSTSNRAVIYGSPTSLRFKVARTGDPATDAAGNPTEAKWTSFITLALPGGTNGGPIFLAKTNARKNNVGLWALSSTGAVRRLIGIGDDLDGLTVKKMTLLNPAIGAPAAPRSFDAAGSVAVFLNFQNGESAIVRIGIP